MTLNRLDSIIQAQTTSERATRTAHREGDAVRFPRMLEQAAAEDQTTATTATTTATVAKSSSATTTATTGTTTAATTATSTAAQTTTSGSGGTGTSNSIAAQTGASSTSDSASTANVFGLVTKDPYSTASASTTAATTTVARPTAESVFGSSPWMSSPGGYSAALGSYSYNPEYFATKETAEKVATLLGGTVVQTNAMTGSDTSNPFKQTVANYMVQLPNGHLVNPGLTATYYTHGWSQSQIDTMLGYDRSV